MGVGGGGGSGGKGVGVVVGGGKILIWLLGQLVDSAFFDLGRCVMRMYLVYRFMAEFTYLVFILLCSCDVFPALINSLVC